ncbi:hypothetical protein NQ318_020164 [Aromia moschata]|uniref:Uncharacterized protein n=1 Tax=Aromia moschata TaxID=1265417 RepID=A0AAV8ZBC2_9CUCU|nr:hypothetical protein NQ318_020164 [Aromia moschata]
MFLTYEVCELSNDTGIVAPDLATLRRRDFEGRDINFEQRCAIRFCFRLGHSATDTFPRLQHAYGNSVFSRAQWAESNCATADGATEGRGWRVAATFADQAEGATAAASTYMQIQERLYENNLNPR